MALMSLASIRDSERMDRVESFKLSHQLSGSCSAHPGRMAMTCCADDTSFLGYVCRSAYAPKLNAGDWVKIRAKVRYANLSVYGGEGPVLEAENIEPAEPIEELVYFN